MKLLSQIYKIRYGIILVTVAGASILFYLYLDNREIAINPFFVAASIFLLSLYILAFLSVATKREGDSYKEIIAKLDNVRLSLESKKDQLQSDINERRERILNIPNISFHFVNKDEITNFYNDYFKEPKVSELVNELVTGTSGEATGKIPEILEAKIGSSDLSKWVSTIKLPDISVSEMFRRYQRETIKNNQVTLGLELVDIDLSDLNEFDKLVNQLEKVFDFSLQQEQLDEQRSRLRLRAAEKTIVRLENASGRVLIEGKFRITDTVPDFYKCIYEHPVNEYIGEKSNPITITMLLKKNAVESNFAGNYAQSINKLIPLRVYGEIWAPINRAEANLELQITPLAVY